MNLSVRSIANYRQRFSCLFDYAIRKKYLDHNVIKDIETSRSPADPPEIFTVNELQALLDSASPELLPTLVLGSFCGLRTAELLRLDWHEVNLATGEVEVLAKNAKSARRRNIEMSPNLKEWLLPYSGYSGAVCPFDQDGYHRAVLEARKAAGLATWPRNGLRHSFASYHLAKHRNAPQLSLDMGHAVPKMVFEHYRAVVTRDAAQRYWEIRPPAAALNVVDMIA